MLCSDIYLIHLIANPNCGSDITPTPTECHQNGNGNKGNIVVSLNCEPTELSQMQMQKHQEQTNQPSRGTNMNEMQCKNEASTSNQNTCNNYGPAQIVNFCGFNINRIFILYDVSVSIVSI